MPQPIQHLEPYIDAAVATLRAGLDAQIDLVNGDHTDLQIDHVPDESICFGGWKALNYPLVEVASPDFAMTNLSLGQVAADLGLAVVVRCLQSDYDPERLYRKALRYSAALIATLMQPDAFGDGVTINRDQGISGSYRTNPETGEKEELVGSSLLIFRLDGQEVRL